MATTASPPFISSSLNSTCTSFRTSLPTCSFSPKLLPRRPLASFSVKASRKQVEVGKRFCCYDLKNLITVLVGSHNSSWFEPDVVRQYLILTRGLIRLAMMLTKKLPCQGLSSSHLARFFFFNKHTVSCFFYITYILLESYP